jgi:hypothetical protein
MEVLNAMNCSAVHFIAVQTPSDAHDTLLSTITDRGFMENSKVKGIQESDCDVDHINGLASH